MKRTPEDGPEEVTLTREESLESAGQHGEESALQQGNGIFAGPDAEKQKGRGGGEGAPRTEVCVGGSIVGEE